MRVLGFLIVLTAFATAALGQPTTESVRAGVLTRLARPTPLRLTCDLKTWWVKSASEDLFDPANWFEKFPSEMAYEVAAVGRDFRMTVQWLAPRFPPYSMSWCQGECILDWRDRVPAQIQIWDNPKINLYSEPILTAPGFWCFQTFKPLEQLFSSERFRVTGADAEGVHFESGFADLPDNVGRFSGVLDPDRDYLPVRLMHEFGQKNEDGSYSHRWELRTFSAKPVGPTWIIEHGGVLSYVGVPGFDSAVWEYTVLDARVDPMLTAEDLPIVFERRSVTVIDQVRKQLTEFDEQGQAIKESPYNAPDYYVSPQTAGRPRPAGVVEPGTRQLYFQRTLLLSGALTAACLGAFFVRRGRLARNSHLAES